MASAHARVIWWRKAAAIAPLIVVICAALIWSGYATYHHALGPIQPDGEHRVPGAVAWTLIAALDGSVVVTTPIWLSTVLPAGVRRYAAAICSGALGGSMLINGLETGWPGVFPPLIAGLLIHLVGVVLRAFAQLGRGEEVVPAPREESIGPSVPEVEHEMPPVDSVPAVRALPAARPVSTKALSPRELVFRLLDSADEAGEKLPSGPELLDAVQRAGHSVNKEYGRTTKAEWRRQRGKRVSA